MKHKPKILYIEDKPETIDAVRVMLQRRGLDLVGVTEGQEGLDHARADKPDLILLGLEMPGLDGWHVHRELMADDALKDIPVIVVTGHEQSIATQGGLDMASVAGYITKPFGPRELLGAIYRVLGKD
jgi:twitching motility two-component system response regulator PilH